MKKNLLFILPVISLMSVTGCSKSSSATLLPPTGSTGGCQTTIGGNDNQSNIDDSEDLWFEGTYALPYSYVVEEACANATYVNNVKSNLKRNNEYTYDQAGQLSEGSFNEDKYLSDTTYEMIRYEDSFELIQHEQENVSISGVKTSYPAYNSRNIYYKTDKNISVEGNVAFANNYYENDRLVNSAFCTELLADLFESTFSDTCRYIMNSLPMYWSYATLQDYLTYLDSVSFGSNETILINQKGDVRTIYSFFFVSSIDYDYQGDTYHYQVMINEVVEANFKNSKEFGYIYTDMTSERKGYVASYTLNSESTTINLDRPIVVADESINVEINYQKVFAKNPNLPVYEEKYAYVEPVEYLNLIKEDTQTNSQSYVSISNVNTTLDSRLDDDSFTGYTFNFSKYLYASSTELYTIANSSRTILTELVDTGKVTLSKLVSGYVRLAEVNNNYYVQILKDGYYTFNVTTDSTGAITNITITH